MPAAVANWRFDHLLQIRGSSQHLLWLIITSHVSRQHPFVVVTSITYQVVFLVSTTKVMIMVFHVLSPEDHRRFPRSLRCCMSSRTRLICVASQKVTRHTGLPS